MKEPGETEYLLVSVRYQYLAVISVFTGTLCSLLALGHRAAPLTH